MAQSFALGKNIGLQGQGSLCDQHTTRISTQNVRGPCSMRAQAVAEARHDFLRNSFEDTHGNQWFEKPSETCKGAAHHT